jgi:hypothetical protein
MRAMIHEFYRSKFIGMSLIKVWRCVFVSDKLPVREFRATSVVSLCRAS